MPVRSGPAVVVCILAMLTLAACSPLWLASPQPSPSATTQEVEAADEPVPRHRTCQGFTEAWIVFTETADGRSTTREYAEATKTFAFSVGKQAVKIGDEELRSAFNNMAAATATYADGLNTAGSATVAEELAFRSAIAGINELCGTNYTFAD